MLAVSAGCIDYGSPEKDIQGVYIIILNEPLSPEVAYEAALDVFHTKIAIDDLETFEFQVMNMDGNLLDSGDYGLEHESYSMGDNGDIDRQMSHDDWDDYLLGNKPSSKPAVN